jgi:hypothetical protein
VELLPNSRSWTDTVTNSIFFKSLDAAHYLKWTLNRSGFDHFLGPEFVHEYTHHWCFQTLVGSALAFMDLRLRVFAEACPDGRVIWARDWIASHCLTSLLRPVAEGLALFSEFDAYQTEVLAGRRLGTPIGAASLCFANNPMPLFTDSMLQEVRHSNVFLDRKASLYLKRFEVKDGYLPGYITIKNLYFIIAQYMGKILNVEIFMCYVRSFFWDDAGFVNILVSEEMNGISVVQAIEQRFRQRMVSLFSDTQIGEKIDLFWQKWTTSGKKRFSSDINISPEEAEMGVERLTQLLHHSIDLLKEKGERIEQTIGIATSDLTELFGFIDAVRGYVVIARCPATVETNKVIFHSDTDTDAVAQSQEFADALPAPGKYECYAVTSTYANFFSLVFRNDAGVSVAGVIKPAEILVDYERLEHFVYKWPIFVAQTERLTSQFLSSGYSKLHAPVLEKMIAHIEQTCLDIYVISSCLRVGDTTRIEARRASLRANGLRDIIGRNSLGLRVAAAISLLPPQLGTFGPFTSGLVGMARLYYFPDIEEAELCGVLKQLAAADTDSIILKQIEDMTLVFV